MQEREISVRDFRQKLAEMLNDAGVRDQIIYITSRGRRVAALVPVPVADRALSDQAGHADS